MGHSKFLYGNGILDDAAVSASSVKPSTSDPVIQPAVQGSATLNLDGDFAGSESDLYRVVVVNAEATGADSEVTNAEFVGQSNVSRDADLSVIRELDTAPAGTYELICDDAGSQDTVAEIRIADEYTYSANIGDDAYNYAEHSLSGEAGNRIFIRCHCVMSSDIFTGATAAGSYPRPAMQLLRISTEPSAAFPEDVGTTVESESSIMPAAFSSQAWLGQYASRPIFVPQVSGSGEYAWQTPTIDSSGFFVPQLNDARFVVGYPAESPATDMAPYLELCFLDRVFREYSKSAEDGTQRFKILNTPREGGAIPRGLVAYPVVGGYCIQIFLTNASGTHLADFYYTHFPYLSSDGTLYWFPITTWGELSWALYMHREMGWYHSGSSAVVMDAASILRYPLLKWGSSSVPDVRHRNIANIANQEINSRYTGTVGFPTFTGGVGQFESFRILDRTAINVMSDGLKIAKSTIVGELDHVDEDQNSVFLVTVVNDRTRQTVELMPQQSYREALLAAGVPSSLIPLDFTLPQPEASGIGTPDNIVVINGDLGKDYTVTLKGDTPDNPRTTKICVHHIHRGVGLRESLTVRLTYTKYVAEECQPCLDYVPDDYNGACIGDTDFDDDGTGWAEIQESVDIFGNSILTPIPTFTHGRGLLGNDVKFSSFSEWYAQAWGSAYLYLRKTDFGAGVDLNAYISALDVIQDSFEDELFRLVIVDRSAIPAERRNDPNAPDYSILLGAHSVTSGDVIEPEISVDPFCGELTSGCCPGFGGVVYPSEDGGEYTAGGTAVYPNLSGGGNTSLVLSTLKEGGAKSFGYSVYDTPLQLTENDNYGLEFLDTPAGSQPWYFQQPVQCIYTQFDDALEHFLTRYLPYFFSAFPTGVHPATIKAEAEALQADRDLWRTDPYQYMETRYSSHSSWNDIFKWLYSLPTTRSERMIHTDLRHPEGVRDRITWLRENSTQQAFCVNGALATSKVVQCTIRVDTPSFTHHGAMADYTEAQTATFTQPAKSETVFLTYSFEYTKSWSQCITEIYEIMANLTATAISTESLGYFDPDPATIYQTHTVLTVNKQYVSQNPNNGVTYRQISAITGYVSSMYPTAARPGSWEVLHFGAQMPVSKLPSAGGTALETWNGSHGIVLSPGASDTGFNGYKVMEQIFWLRLLKLLAKAGYSWDYETFIQACPPVENRTNHVGCPDGSGSGCSNWSAKTDYWRVDAEGEDLPPAYTNHTYYDLVQKRFSFLVACRCPEDIQYGDLITIRYIAPSLDNVTYKRGDGFVIPMYAAGSFVSAGGMDDQDVAQWRFRFPLTSGQGDIVLSSIPNYTDYGVYTVTSDRLRGFFTLALRLVSDYFRKGDRFTWSVSGGQYLVYSQELGVSSPLYLSSVSENPFPLGGHGVSLNFAFNKGVPFKLGDQWNVLFRQNHAPSNVVSWDLGSWWQSDGVDVAGESLVFNFGSGNSRSIMAMALIGHNLTSNQNVFLEAKNVVDVGWTNVVGAAIPVYGAMRTGYPVPPVIHLFSTATTAYEMWRVRITDPLSELTDIVVSRVILADATSGYVNLLWDHQPIMSVELKYNPDAFSAGGSGSGLNAPYVNVIEDAMVEYSLMYGEDFEKLIGLIHALKTLSNAPFVWVPTDLRPDRARVCQLATSTIRFEHRDAEFTTTDASKVYSGLTLPLRVIDPNREAE